MSAFVFPADPLNPRRVEEYFAPQATLARDLGAATVVIDHDALLAGRLNDAVRRVPEGIGALCYRGWMIPSPAYAQLESALAPLDAHLVTGPEDYRRAHEFPGWYSAFAAVTPPGEWIPVPDDLPAALQALSLGGRAIVKDFVKSRKHEWDEACFIPSVADTEATARVVRRFLELQGTDLQGGLVFRGFEEFVGPQARVWWVDGKPVLVTPHPDTPDDVVQPEIEHITGPVRDLGCRFVTTDLARRSDGVWRVVEVGDGQVSDFPAGGDTTTLFSALHSLLD